MMNNRLLVLGVAIGVAIVGVACKTPAPAPEAGVSIGCNAPDQDRCWEFPQPSAEQRTNIGIACTSVSGVLSSPAKCPTAKFIGKCTIPGTAKDGPEARRWYKADDAAYQQDFCTNTAKGAWSTTF